ncbi:lipoprotein-releasing ABC transporter permease subunit [Frigidibacter sp. RF13]|uniref:lipoprotein-releasing ABC transporter permease subunit n=1 Tax=Frigidibacter sp. RF13 TaxID=2997340 RepID=UPI002271CB78|nr:lipoprotein-releasing ABC transporter permease subunit [Frigidibacter sp. RF13]MCY1128507.1 lipoprotein-releasing ABC transporter permease subunit [Frigidibacter sp. RF13]
MAGSTRPFSRFEFLIAWRYLRARRAEGGISVMTWISLVGIALGVMALVATLAVRAGFRAEFVGTILGANAHVTVYKPFYEDEDGVQTNAFRDYEAAAARIAAVPGVVRAAPVVRGQAMVSHNDSANVAEVYGISAEDLNAIPGVAQSDQSLGEISDFEKGIAVGSGIARDLGIVPGDRVKLIQPNGARTAFGTSPRVNAYEVTYIFSVGRYDIDKTRIYMPLAEAQSFFNREGGVSEIEVMVADPEAVDGLMKPVADVVGQDVHLWTWKDASDAFLEALTIEDNVMFVILALIVLIAAMNITSGLVMLVKNKGRDIGILRTMGLTEGSILRVFFLCGAFIGVIGTLAGVALGCLLALNMESIMSGVNWLSGGNAWDPSIRGIYRLPAKLQAWDLVRAVGLSLILSFIVTYFPARRAARLNPVEALRYE